MEACAEQNIPDIILDRPNPNGHYVAGPILDTAFKSFVGMHPIPIVHGCTVGELAQMINKENWLKNSQRCDLKIITCKNYTHNTKYQLPIKPSPNLPNQQSINLYPSLCLFEGTNISVGRGTKTPFQIIGSPQYKNIFSFEFTPKSTPGAKNPKHQDNVCYGLDLTQNTNTPFTLKYIVQFYQECPDKESFFQYAKFFNKLAGNSLIIDQIKEGKSSKEIEQSWLPQLKEYLTLRHKYLLYPDFTE